MADDLHLELVSADRVVWSGEAKMVLTRTTEGELGVMAHHTPLMGVLVPGTVEVRAVEGADLVAAVDGGFLSHGWFTRPTGSNGILYPAVE